MTNVENEKKFSEKELQCCICRKTFLTPFKIICTPNKEIYFDSIYCVNIFERISNIYGKVFANKLGNK